MVRQTLLLALFLWSSTQTFGQDERYYRQMLTGELQTINQEIRESKGAQFNVNGPYYLIDLNSDGVEEKIQPQKRDGVDWVEIKNYSGSTLFEAKLLAMGAMSSIYKMRLFEVKPGVKALVIFFDEGFTRGRRFESTARFFVLTFVNGDIAKGKITQGPHYFHEREGQREQYSRRTYVVNIYDVDNDGTREIVTHYNHIQRILKYKSEGEWQRL